MVALTLSLNSFAQSETYKYIIASKDFGTDSLSGLNKQLIVWGLFPNAKTACISVYYDIVLINNNRVITILTTGIYYADNNTDAKNFDVLFSSPLGVGIKADIAYDLLKIQSDKTVEQDLIQK